MKKRLNIFYIFENDKNKLTLPYVHFLKVIKKLKNKDK